MNSEDLQFDDLINDRSKDYWIKGDTFPVKEEIKAWGGYYVPEKRCWRVDCTEPSDPAYKALKGLDCELVPVVLSPECQRIQDILNKK